MDKLLTANYHIRPGIETIKKHTAIMQYLDTHLNTCVNAERCGNQTDSTVRGMEWYLFGEDPMYNYECESWMDDYTIEESINEEFKKLCHTIDAISTAYTGVRRHDMLYTVLKANGACGRAMIRCKLFIDADGTPGSVENGGLSLYNIIDEDYDAGNELLLYRFPSIGEFTSNLYDVVMEEVNRMTLIDRYLTHTELGVGENTFTDIGNVDMLDDTVFEFIQSGQHYYINFGASSDATALYLAIWYKVNDWSK